MDCYGVGGRRRCNPEEEEGMEEEKESWSGQLTWNSSSSSSRSVLEHRSNWPGGRELQGPLGILESGMH